MFMVEIIKGVLLILPMLLQLRVVYILSMVEEMKQGLGQLMLLLVLLQQLISMVAVMPLEFQVVRF